MEWKKLTGMLLLSCVLAVSVTACGTKSAKEEVTATEEPAATEDAASPEESEAAQTEEPAATEAADETQEPEQTEEAGETQEPEQTEEAEQTEEPKEDKTEKKDSAKKDNSKFSTGTWDGLTFTNQWLNLSFRFPEGTQILGEEEINQMLGNGKEMLINSGTITDKQAEIADFTTAYDFMVKLSDGSSSIQLAYENTAIATLGKGTSEKKYLESLQAQMETVEDYGYEFGEVEEVKLGGQNYYKLPGTLLNGLMKQDIYCQAKGKYIAYMIASYLTESEDIVNDVISNITAAE